MNETAILSSAKWADQEQKIKEIAYYLINNNLTISLAESATGGYLTHLLSLVEDSGKFLKGAVTCYDANIKEKLLKVDQELILKYTAESFEVTKAIAEGVMKLMDTDLAIGVTGLTRPGGSETKEKPVGTMFIYGMFKDQVLFKKSALFTGKPEVIVQKTCYLIISQLQSNLFKIKN